MSEPSFADPYSKFSTPPTLFVPLGRAVKEGVDWFNELLRAESAFSFGRIWVIPDMAFIAHELEYALL